LDDDATIYVQGASDSWTPESDAGVGVEDVEAPVESLPPEADGRTYFLEVAVAAKLLSGHARRSREGDGDTTLASQPTGDVQESSQPPPSRISAHNRTTPAEDDIEFGDDP
jgi:hypothetical protein